MGKGILLLSGGMDSVSLLGWLLIKGWEIYPVIFNYGQKHKEAENEAAKKVWDFFKREYSTQLFPYKIIKIDLTQIGNSALTDSKINIPDVMVDQPLTVVPHRNATMVTLASAYGLGLGIYDIFITPVLEDRTSYPDCHPLFYKALSTMLSASANKDVSVYTPFIDWWKKDIVAWGLQNKIPYHLSYTCYKGIIPACGTCNSCEERRAAFIANKVNDPIPYVDDKVKA